MTTPMNAKNEPLHINSHSAAKKSVKHFLRAILKVKIQSLKDDSPFFAIGNYYCKTEEIHSTWMKTFEEEFKSLPYCKDLLSIDTHYSDNKSIDIYVFYSEYYDYISLLHSDADEEAQEKMKEECDSKWETNRAAMKAKSKSK